ncbi:SH3 domain-containing protein 19 [Discoglossus pictus]
MAEAWLEEEEEELRELRDNAGNRRHRRSNLNQAAERSERNKPEHRFPGQGPLSSIRAVIKRTSRTTTDQQRDRRRPEITIVAAEPIGPGSWFHGGPQGGLGFPPPPPPQWSQRDTHQAEPPSYEQVIKEINQVQVTTTNSNVEPRRTSTCATQTDFHVEEERNVPGNSIIDQPLPCVHELASVQRPIEISRQPLSLVANNEKDSAPQIAGSRTTEITIKQEDSNVLRYPVPRPRRKVNHRPVGNNLSIYQDNSSVLFQSTQETELPSSEHSLAFDDSLGELLETTNMSHERSQNSIVSRIKAFESQTETSEQFKRPEIVPRNLNAKSSVTVKPIPAPKPLSHRTSGEWDPLKDNKPKPTPREGLVPPRLQDAGGVIKPDLPKKPKPSLVKSSSNGGDCSDITRGISVSANTSNNDERKVPVPAPRPILPKKPLQPNNPAALPRPVVSATAPKLFVATQAKAFNAAEITALRPPAPISQSKSFGELDLISFDDDILSPVVLPSPEVTNDSKENDDPFQLFPKDDAEKEQPAAPAPQRKPTIIRISGKLTKSSEELQIPPPLPAEKPVGSLYSKTSVKPRPTVKKEWEKSESAEEPWSKPVLPARPPGVKVIETHHPPQKGPPGRPPPPRVSKPASQRDAMPRASSDMSLSARHNTSGMSRSKSQVLKRPQPELPPRPKPGHPLYNKYMLPVPHGIAEKDIVPKNPGDLSCKRGEVLVLLEPTDSNSIHCQKGSATGEVKVSNMKIITPLEDNLDTRQKDIEHVNKVEDNNTPHALVLHDFIAEHADDLSLNAGDTVYLLEKIDHEWYKGKCKDSTGLFPANHIRVMVDIPEKVNPKNVSSTTVTKGPCCMARFEFIGDQKDELSFSEGDMIILREYVNEEWAKGELKGRTGIFPINFVEIIEDLPACGANKIVSNAVNKIPGNASQKQTSSGEWCEAMYDFAAESEEDLSFKRGDKILIIERLDSEWYKGRLNGKEGILPTAFVQLCSGPKPQQTQEGNPGMAKALYDFCGENEDELSFKAGDILSAVESIDHEWMKGELHGRSGIFPRNFVQSC